MCRDLGKRELRLFLLVIRLTYGCRDNAWATLRPGDLNAIGIHPSHARLCLRKLLSTGLILRDGDSHRYRANPKWTPKNSKKVAADESICRHNELKALVGRNLGRSRSGTEGLPAVTVEISAQGQETQNATILKADSSMYTDLNLPEPERASTRWRFDRQQHRFQATEDTSLTGELS